MVEEFYKTIWSLLEPGGMGGQGIFQGFASGAKGGFDDFFEECFIYCRYFRNAGAEAQDHGVDFGGGIKIVRAQGEQPLQVEVVLEQDRQDAVIFAAGSGQQALANFLLHHQDHNPDGLFFLQQLEEQGRGDLIGQVADDGQGMIRFPAAGQEIEVEGILGDDLDIGQSDQDFFLNDGGQALVQFQGHDLSGGLGQKKGEGTQAGAYFHDGFPAVQFQGSHETAGLVGMKKKVLPQGFFRRQPVTAAENFGRKEGHDWFEKVSDCGNDAQPTRLHNKQPQPAAGQ